MEGKSNSKPGFCVFKTRNPTFAMLPMHVLHFTCVASFRLKCDWYKKIEAKFRTLSLLVKTKGWAKCLSKFLQVQPKNQSLIYFCWGAAKRAGSSSG